MKTIMIIVIAIIPYVFAIKAHAATGNDASEIIIIKSPKDYADTPWAKLNIPPGTKLSIRKTESGKELHYLEFEGGVSISEGEDGSILGMDDSKNGAVLCWWGIYTSIKAVLDECHLEETEFRKEIDLVVEKLKNFIVANSLSPVTKSELTDYVQNERKKLHGKCENKEMEQFIKQFKSMPLQKIIDESLAVPRPPVTNPCL